MPCIQADQGSKERLIFLSSIEVRFEMAGTVGK